MFEFNKVVVVVTVVLPTDLCHFLLQNYGFFCFGFLTYIQYYLKRLDKINGKKFIFFLHFRYTLIILILYSANSKRGFMEQKKRGKKGRPSLGGDYEKTVLFTLRMKASMRARLRPVPADEIRYYLDLCATRFKQGGLLDTRERPPMKRVDPPADAPQGPGDGAQGAQVDASTPGPGEVGQDSPKGPRPPAPGKTGWAAGQSRCPDTETLFTE